MGETTDSRDSYRAENVDTLVSELFSGKLTISEALKRLRIRLLDLSPRNRLINYKHPKRRSVQFVDVSNWNHVYDRLVDHKTILLKPIPEPEPLMYTGKRPEARQYAEQLSINISFELSPSLQERRNSSIQTLLDPTDLERLLRKLASEAKMAIEETGTNMLYLVFGFLEFYESESSDLALNSPLLCLPVSLNRGSIDPVTRVYQYNITYNGEDINENQTLRATLKQSNPVLSRE